MKVAYLIDRESTGGGCEYIRRKIAALPKGDEGRAFYSSKGECTWAVLRAWGAEKVVVNHLRAAVQLFNPLRAAGRGGYGPFVTFVVHGVHLRKYDWLPKTVVNRVKRTLRRLSESWLYHRCDGLVALTERDAIDIRRLYGRNLKIDVEPNTVDGWKPPEMAATFEGERFDYVYIGRFEFQKGQDRWLEEMGRRVRSGDVRVRTLFIGDGKLLAPCRKLAEKLDVSGYCRFAGGIPEAERYLKCANTVVSTSRWEGLPYLLLKARALGCRVLATDCPGNREALAGYGRWRKLQWKAKT